MNEELRQRIIGAVVVTALAAIFVPMLFEDPVDSQDQLVSTLPIPAEPSITIEDTEHVQATPETTQTPDNAAADSLNQDVLSQDELDAEAPEEEIQEQLEEPVASTSKPPRAKSTLNDAAQDDADFSDDIAPIVETKPLVKKVATKAEPAIVKKPALAKPSSTQHKSVEIVSVQKLPPVTPKSKAEPPSRWFLQAGSFSKKENAVILTDSLRKQGFPVLLETIQVDGQGTFYRLKVGPELDKKRADSMKAKLDKQNIHSLLIAE